MSNRQNFDQTTARMTGSGDIAAAAERNQDFPKLNWKVSHRPSHLRELLK